MVYLTVLYHVVSSSWLVASNTRARGEQSKVGSSRVEGRKQIQTRKEGKLAKMGGEGRSWSLFFANDKRAKQFIHMDLDAQKIQLLDCPVLLSSGLVFFRLCQPEPGKSACAAAAVTHSRRGGPPGVCSFGPCGSLSQVLSAC